MTLDDLGVHRPVPDLDEPASEPAERGRAAGVVSTGVGRRPTSVVAAVGLAITIGVGARFVTVSPMWLDEALTVNIAGLPLGDLLEALRHDGAPPLYYVLLHAWMAVVGTGDVAVRALSGLASVASLPLMWMAGRRLAGERTWVRWAAVLLLASSPFAIRYATEARMYSLVVLLVLAGFLALDTLLRRRSRRAAAVLGAVTGLLLLTHYWSFFLAAVVAGLLVLRWRRPDLDQRAGARRALSAMAAGLVLFLPWLPSFLEQMTTTGTPWGAPPRPRAVFEVVMQFASGLSDTALPLGLLLYALLALGLFGSAVGAGLVTLDVRGRAPGRMLAAAAGSTIVLAIVVGRVTGSAFAIRYAAVVLPLVLLLAALGSATLAGSRVGQAVLALAVVLGFVTAIPHLAGDRTSAGRVAAALRSEAGPGDVVAYCPDQLGPSVSRQLGAAPGLVQLTFPRARGPELVDWVGYEAANRAVVPAEFARMLLERAGPDRSVWVVWAPNYRTFGTKCQALLTALREARPQERRVLNVSTTTFERPGLVQFPA